MLRGSLSIHMEMANYVVDIKEISGYFGSITFQYIPDSFNTMTHELARMGCLGCNALWCDWFPLTMVSLYLSDFSFIIDHYSL